MSIIKKIKIWRLIVEGNSKVPSDVWSQSLKGEYIDEYEIHYKKYFENIEKALRIDPSSEYAYRDKFYKLNYTKRHRECIELGKYILDRFSDHLYDSETMLIISKNYIELNQKDNAKEYLRQIIESKKTIRYTMEEARKLLDSLS